MDIETSALWPEWSLLHTLNLSGIEYPQYPPREAQLRKNALCTTHEYQHDLDRLHELWVAAEHINEPATSDLARLVSPESPEYARWAVLTQTAIKYLYPEADATSLQGKGGNDARSYCKKVISPFNHYHGSPIEPADDPYTTALRHPNLIATPELLEAHSDKPLWTELSAYAKDLNEKGEQFVEDRLLRIMARLRVHAVERAALSRRLKASSNATIRPLSLTELMKEYVRTPSKGRRNQIVLAALAEKQPHITTKVHPVNAADTRTGNVFDVDVFDHDDLAYSIEVKDYAPETSYLVTTIGRLVSKERLSGATHIPLVFVFADPVSPESVAASVAEGRRYGFDIRFFTFDQWIDAHTSVLTVAECERVKERLVAHAERFGVGPDREALAALFEDCLDSESLDTVEDDEGDVFGIPGISVSSVRAVGPSTVQERLF